MFSSADYLPQAVLVRKAMDLSSRKEAKVRKGPVADPAEILEGMVTVVREAGDAALALQV